MGKCPGLPRRQARWRVCERSQSAPARPTRLGNASTTGRGRPRCRPLGTIRVDREPSDRSLLDGPLVLMESSMSFSLSIGIKNEAAAFEMPITVPGSAEGRSPACVSSTRRPCALPSSSSRQPLSGRAFGTGGWTALRQPSRLRPVQISLQGPCGVDAFRPHQGPCPGHRIGKGACVLRRGRIVPAGRRAGGRRGFSGCTTTQVRVQPLSSPCPVPDSPSSSLSKHNSNISTKHGHCSEKHIHVPHSTVTCLHGTVTSPYSAVHPLNENVTSHS